jgi:hypothetical protein
MQLDHLAPHDLRRTCAKLCHVNGGEPFQFLLGHASVVTMERYLGCKQNLEEPVNDRFGCLFSKTLDLRYTVFSPIEINLPLPVTWVQADFWLTASRACLR